MRVFYGSVAGTFDAEAVALSFRPKLLAVNDWDEDGDADIAIVESPLSGQSAHVWVALSGGTALDQLPPSVALTSPRPGSRIAGLVAITASASDNRGVKKVEFYVNDTLIGTSTGPGFSLAWDSRTWPDGRVQLKTRAFDAALNWAQSTRIVVTIANHFHSSVDLVAPVVNVGGSIFLEAAGPDGAVVNFAGTASDNIDGPLPITCLPASGTSFSLQSSQVTCSATDSAGNTGWGYFTVVVVDTTPPWITTSADMTVNATSAGAFVTYFASAVDVVSGNVSPDCTPASGTIFPVGTTTVTCTAADRAGNSASRSFKVTVRQAATAIRHAPRAQSAHYTMRAGSVLSERLRAREHDGDPLTFWVVSSPASGTLQLLNPATGAFRFTPAVGATGSVTFSFQVSDGRLLSDIAAVAIDIRTREHEREREREGVGVRRD
jgi:Big-like domain-containing protein/HYR domain-containing protein